MIKQFKCRQQNVALQFQNNNCRRLNVTYIYGPAGSGKTRFVLDKCDLTDVYFVSRYDQSAFYAYRGERIIFFDDFASQIDISDMLCFLDGYSLVSPCQYKDCVARYVTVYLASDISLDKQYLDVQAREPEIYEAFLRRVNHVIRFDSLGVQHTEK